MRSHGAAFRHCALVGVLADGGALEEARREAERMVEFGRLRRLLPAEGRGL